MDGEQHCQQGRRTISSCSSRILSSSAKRSSVPLYNSRSGPYNPALFRGGIAQLGERLHGMQEVRGSIPRTSTSIAKENFRVPIV